MTASQCTKSNTITTRFSNWKPHVWKLEQVKGLHCCKYCGWFTQNEYWLFLYTRISFYPRRVASQLACWAQAQIICHFSIKWKSLFQTGRLPDPSSLDSSATLLQYFKTESKFQNQYSWFPQHAKPSPFIWFSQSWKTPSFSCISFLQQIKVNQRLTTVLKHMKRKKQVFPCPSSPHSWYHNLGKEHWL